MKNGIRLAVLLMAVLIAGCNSNDKKSTEKTGEIPAEKNTVVKKTIVFFGNSLTAGYGLSPSEAFPAIIQQKIDSANLPYKVVNAGVSGETSSGGNSRIDWILRQPLDVFILELGANDGLRGIPITETKKNLQSIVDKVKAKYPSAKLVLAGMQIPPNMGQQYATEFRNIYSELAEKNQMTLIPFLLEETSEKIIELIFNLNKEAGTTLILVTHDLDLANKTGRIIKLKGGKVVSDEATVGSAYAV